MATGLRRLIVVGATLAVLGSGCGAQASASASVAIDHSDSTYLGGTYSPATLRISAGTEVTWTERDTRLHTVTADDGSFGSNFLNPGQTYAVRFNKPGTYRYHCAIHPHMTGDVIVS